MPACWMRYWCLQFILLSVLSSDYVCADQYDVCREGIEEGTSCCCCSCCQGRFIMSSKVNHVSKQRVPTLLLLSPHSYGRHEYIQLAVYSLKTTPLLSFFITITFELELFCLYRRQGLDSDDCLGRANKAIDHRQQPNALKTSRSSIFCETT